MSLRSVVLRRVRLRNILSHENTEITFEPGLTAIVGPNGAGKSTIIDAIVYALLSKRGTVRGSRKSDMLRLGASEGEIEVELDVGGVRYVIRRVVRASGSDDAQLLYVDQGKTKLVASGVESVTRYVLEEIFGVPSPEAIRYTIVARQDELTKLLDLKPAERKDAILKLLGLQDLEKAREVLRPAIRNLEALRGRLDEVSRNVSKLEARAKSISMEIDRVLKQMEAVSKEVEEARKRKEFLELVRDIALKVVELREKARLVEELRSVEEDLSKLKRVLEVEPLVRSIDVGEARARLRDLAEVSKRLKELRARKEEIDVVIDGVCRELELLGIARECNEDNVDDIVRSALDEVRKSIARIEAELRVVSESKNVVVDSNECPVCRRPLGEELRKSILSELSDREARLGKELERLKSIESKLSMLYAKARKLRSSRIEIVSKIEEFVSKLEELTREAREILRKAKSVREEVERILGDDVSTCSSVKSHVDFIQCVQDLVKNARGRFMTLEERRRELYSKLEGVDVATLLRDLEILEGRLRDLGVDPSQLDLKSLESEYRRHLDRVRELESKLVALRQRLSDLEKQREETVRELEELRSEYERLSKEIELLPILSYIHDRVLGRDGILARELTKMARRIVQSYANAVLRSLGLDLSIEITPEFDIVVRSGSGEISIRSVSGGEKTAIATALRMALAYAVMGRVPGFFILDEPTAHLDAERREVLFDLIKKVSQALPQVIVATHDIEVIEKADRVIEVFKVGTKSVVRYLSPTESTALQNTLAPASTSPSTVRG